MINLLLLRLNKLFVSFKLFSQFEILVGLLTSIIGGISSILEIFSIYMIFSLISGRNLGANIFEFLDSKMLLILLLFFRIVFGYTFLKLQTYISFSPSKRIADKLYSTMLQDSYEKYRTLKASDYVTSICSNSGLLPHYLILPSIVLISESVVILVILTYIIFFSTKVLVFGLLVISLFTLAIYFYSNKKLKHVGAARENFENERINLVIDTFNNWETLVIHNSSMGFKSKFDEISSSFQQTWIRTHYYSNLPKFYLEILVSVFLVSFYSALKYFPREEVGIFFSAIILAVRLAPSFARIINSIQYFNHGKIISESIQKSFDDINKDQSNLKSRIIIQSNDSILKLEDLSYSVDEFAIIKNINLTLNTGMTTIVGSSGAGKSTLVRLISGIIKSDTGSIKYFGKDVSLQSIISFVPQNVSIFDGNIYQNVSMEFDENNIDKQKVIKCLNQSGFSGDSINFMEDDFCLNKISASSISGGERQRLGIARALYRDAEIICLDEISSALDSTTESQIFTSLREISKNKIVISIAHRLSNLIDQDNVIYMKNGKVECQGSLKFVLGESEEFLEMYNLYFKLQ